MIGNGNYNGVAPLSCPIYTVAKCFIKGQILAHSGKQMTALSGIVQCTALNHQEEALGVVDVLKYLQSSLGHIQKRGLFRRCGCIYIVGNVVCSVVLFLVF